MVTVRDLAYCSVKFLYADDNRLNSASRKAKTCADGLSDWDFRFKYYFHEHFPPNRTAAGAKLAVALY